ncbi:MAG: BTAD domain-containing putative transcriptional regulator [Xanthomonadales bacterium]|nr:BTAD domain-containing putative transcriptional regulator [Xanthomonadales bacterium]
MSDKKRIEARFLGGATLMENGVPLSGTAVRRHPLALLAILAVAPDQAITRPRAIGLLWPDANEATGRNRLSSTVYPLRKLLGNDVLTATADTLRLEPAGLDCDIWRFRDLLESGDAASALRWYRGPFLDGFYLENAELFEDEVRKHRDRLKTEWQQAVQTLAEKSETEQQQSVAAHYWRMLLADDLLDTQTATRLVRALTAAGRRYEALKAAEEHAAALQQELGVKPDAVFMEILNRLRQKPVNTDETPEASIAVLFLDALGDEESNSFGEGIHSGILNRLASVDGLTVIARTSLLRYRDTRLSTAEIGAELGVRWVLEGGIQVRGSQFRLDTRLVEARHNRQVWAYDYTGALNAENYFSVQSEISEALFEKLRHRVTPDERLRLTGLATENLEAHRRATEARKHLDQRSPESMQKALACFEEAVELDPDYALAWVGIADTVGLMQAYGYAGTEVLARAEQAIKTALETDPFCAEAHAAQGRFFGQWRREKEATKSLRRAVALKPGYAEASNWLTIGYHVSGDLAAAVDSSRRAVALNPMSVEALNNAASTLLFLGRAEEALQAERKVLELEPGYGTATFFSGLALIELERFEDALHILDGLELPWAGAGVDTARALASAGLGDMTSARGSLESIRRSGYAFDEGLALAALGETEKAIEALGREDFSGQEFAVIYWPTVCVRYLFKPVWRRLPNEQFRALVERIDASFGLI